MKMTTATALLVACALLHHIVHPFYTPELPQAQRVAIVQCLIAAGASSGFQSGKGSTGVTARQFACARGFPDVTEALLEAGADPNTHTSARYTALILETWLANVRCETLYWTLMMGLGQSSEVEHLGELTKWRECV